MKRLFLFFCLLVSVEFSTAESQTWNDVVTCQGCCLCTKLKDLQANMKEVVRSQDERKKEHLENFATIVREEHQDTNEANDKILAAAETLLARSEVVDKRTRNLENSMRKLMFKAEVHERKWRDMERSLNRMERKEEEVGKDVTKLLSSVVTLVEARNQTDGALYEINQNVQRLSEKISGCCSKSTAEPSTILPSTTTFGCTTHSSTPPTTTTVSTTTPTTTTVSTTTPTTTTILTTPIPTTTEEEIATTREVPTTSKSVDGMEACVEAGVPKPHPTDCKKYIQCTAPGQGQVLECGEGTVFSPKLGNCDVPSLVPGC